MAVVLDYKGLTIKEMSDLRSRLQTTNGICKVTKNSLMRKAIDGDSNWQILDNKRSPHNPVNKFVRANSTITETTNYNVDFLSNGFKIRNADADYNESAQSFIYAAFAEMPFKYATAR